jgi:hypothetical protein
MAGVGIWNSGFGSMISHTTYCMISIPHTTFKSQRCGDKGDKAVRIGKQWSIDQCQENQSDSTEAKLTLKGFSP